MSFEPPGLPSRFPCWCRAVYSWGGESKRDLGFVEGDLIECLNAGDGSWWMGRLRRDKRMMGLFPSNFVQVLGDDFQPATRAPSPLPETKAPYENPTSEQPTTKVFRKAFSAYAAPDLAAKKRAEQQEELRTSRQSSPNIPGQQTRQHQKKNSGYDTRAPSPSPQGRAVRSVPRPTSRNSFVGNSSAPSPQPPAAYHNYPRAVSPKPRYQNHPRSVSPQPQYQNHQRAVSPQPQYQNHPRAVSPQPQYHNYSRGPSPNPYQAHSRAVSPAPYSVDDTYTRAPSPHPHPVFHNCARPTTPAPPGGYVAYSPNRAASPLPGAQQHRPYSRGPSPAPQGSYDSYRAPSPNPHQYYDGGGSRGPSPLPYDIPYQAPSRGVSPAPYPIDDHDSSPPPPPPHRHVHTPQSHAAHEAPRALSPCPPSPGATGFTPSPLRNAMDDVMSSLDGMGLTTQDQIPEQPLDPWSPEAFDQTYSRVRGQGAQMARPATSDNYGNERQGRVYEYGVDEPPVLSNYVQRMESRLKNRYPHTSDESMSERSSTRPINILGHGRSKSSIADRTFQDQPRPKGSMDMSTQGHQGHGVSQSMGGAEDFGTEFDGGLGMPRPKTNPNQFRGHEKSNSEAQIDGRRPKLRHRKSAFEVGKEMIGRTFTTKSTSTNATESSTFTSKSSVTTMTDRSIMSGQSAGAFSATSAGSLNRKKEKLTARAKSAMGMRDNDFTSIKDRFESDSRPTTPMTGVTYHSSHASGRPRANSTMPYHDNGGLGGLSQPRAKKSGFFKKIFESAKTGAASSRKTFAPEGGGGGIANMVRPRSSRGMAAPDGVTAIAGGDNNVVHSVGSARELGERSSGTDWLQVRRDVNRSNSLSQIEMTERKERAEMEDYPAISPVAELRDAAQGDEDVNGDPVDQVIDYQRNLGMVDKNARFVRDVPSGTTPETLASRMVCRPYRSDVQRLRAIFIWVAENIKFEEDFELPEPADSCKVIQTKRGCAEEIAVLVMEMCRAVGIHCQVVRGYLKAPWETLELDTRGEIRVPMMNHWWNTVLVDQQDWRVLDCALASTSHPRRGVYSSQAPTGGAETWYFLARPSEVCFTHVPEHRQHQHLAPSVPASLLMALPTALPAYFRNNLELGDFNTALLRLVDLEVAHLRITVPADVEVVAELQAKAYGLDPEGDLYETGETITKRCLSQAEWIGGQKRYTIKAVLPPSHSEGVVRVFAGKRGLMHSIKDIPHPVALVVPISHVASGKTLGTAMRGMDEEDESNPLFEWVTRHPTPHAMRHDLYIAQPQVGRLVRGNTYVFNIRQHPSSVVPAPNPGADDGELIRPTSAMSNGGSVAGSSYSASAGPTSYSSKKPAKLAIQSPSGKILRLMRKEERGGVAGLRENGEMGDGGVWESIIKVGELGVWRGLVLADRTARWCVCGEWVCV